MKARTARHGKDGALLISVAESIGSTLGAIAAKADAAQKAITRTRVAHTVEREGKKLVRKSKGVVRKTGKAAARNLGKSKLAKAARRGLRRAALSVTRTVGRGTARAGAARRKKSRR
jgi:hypothetical protein